MAFELARGLALVLGSVLSVAGTTKLARLEATRIALGRLAPRGRKPTRRLLTSASVALGGSEALLGGWLVVVGPAVAAASATVVLCAGFVAAVHVARRRGLSCGCFSSFSPGAAGPRESARAIAMLAMATVMTALLVLAPEVGRGAAVLGVMSGAVAGAIALVLAVRVVPPAPERPGGRSSASHADWRRPRPVERRRILRAVRGEDAVRDVVGRAPARVPWWRAVVRVAPSDLVSVVVAGDGYHLQVLAPPSGPAMAVCFTSAGPIVPLAAAY